MTAPVNSKSRLKRIAALKEEAMSENDEKRCGTCRWVAVNRESYYPTYRCAFPIEIPTAYMNRHGEALALLTTRLHSGGPETGEAAGVHCPTWVAKEPTK